MWALTVIVALTLAFVGMTNGADTVRRRSPAESLIRDGLGRVGSRKSGPIPNKLLTNLLIGGLTDGLASGGAGALGALLSGGRAGCKSDDTTVLRMPLAMLTTGLNVARGLRGTEPIDLGDLDGRVIELPVGELVRLLNMLLSAEPLIRRLGVDFGAGLGQRLSSGTIPLQSLLGSELEEELNQGLNSGSLPIQSLLEGLEGLGGLVTASPAVDLGQGSIADLSKKSIDSLSSTTAEPTQQISGATLPTD